MTDRYVDVDWPAPARVRTRMTTRFGGVSGGAYRSFNLALHCGDDPTAVAANRERLARDGVPRVAWLEQVHGIDVVDGGDAIGVPRADASFTRSTEVACAVMVADCLPVLICDRAASVVAAAHCGWRGLAHGVLTALIERLGAPPRSLLAWLGPAIGSARYEVGADVREAFLAARGREAVDVGFAPVGTPRADGSPTWRADLAALARTELNGLGLGSIFGSGLCAYDDARFYSYRRDGTTGRMAAVIWLSDRD